MKKETDKPRGRPRCFDTGEALDAAINVFWRKGYDGASLSDLTKAMKINRPSLYAAFGDKESLFRKALDRYAEGPAAFWADALREPTARRVVEALLGGAARLASESQCPGGCLLIQGGLACGEDGVSRELANRRAMAETGLMTRLERAAADGDLPADADPANLARYVATVIRGMAVQAAGGTTEDELQEVARTALQAWPK
jgi:AcrR family transcriptional regulator